MSTEREEFAKTFLDFSRHKLVGEYWPRTCECLDRLSAEQIWWRPNETSNSIGNLLLHLNGNVRQWIVFGLGEAPANATVRRSSRNAKTLILCACVKR